MGNQEVDLNLKSQHCFKVGLAGARCANSHWALNRDVTGEQEAPGARTTRRPHSGKGQRAGTRDWKGERGQIWGEMLG